MRAERLEAHPWAQRKGHPTGWPAHGKMPNMITQQDVLDAIIYWHGRGRKEIPLAAIYRWVEDHCDLNGNEMSWSYGRRNYTHGVRSHIADLGQAGKIARVGRGALRAD